MSFDFPNSPVPAQEFHTPGGPVYIWQPPVWVPQAIASDGGGSGGDVTSVAGKVGDVVLYTTDLVDWTMALIDGGNF